MRISTRHAACVALAAALTLPACATSRSYVSPVEVTRFTGAEGDDIPLGPIGLRAAPGLDETSDAYAAFQIAVREELEEQGFTVAGDAAPYMAWIGVEQDVYRGQGRDPVSVGGGASAGTYGSGVGLGIGIDLSGPDPDRIDTRLSVRIRPTQGGETLWEGRASFTATDNTEYAELQPTASRMADALFQGFPGNSGETITVE